jgi:capsular polysaccharide export protein
VSHEQSKNSSLAELMAREDEVYALGFYPWKRRLLRAFFPGVRFRFVRAANSIPRCEGVKAVVWGTDHPAEEFPPGCVLWRCEDGFIRSVGLGAKFAPAYSWVVDRRGMYFDARGPSDLEWLIGQADFSPAQLARAAALRELLVRKGLTKYNLREGSWVRPRGAQQVILVPGQVESDASIRFGARGLRTNLELLKAVRESHPWAHVVYKPHPDVAAGVRREGRNESAAGQWCNEVLTAAPMAPLLEAVDEVHVLTSLTGFEALLRGKRVVTYGQPFYAGWGLTEDRGLIERRGRQVSLDHLTAAALIEYPIYLHPHENRRCQPEELLEAMTREDWPDQRGLTEKLLWKLSSFRWWSKWVAG